MERECWAHFPAQLGSKQRIKEETVSACSTGSLPLVFFPSRQELRAVLWLVRHRWILVPAAEASSPTQTLRTEFSWAVQTPRSFPTDSM